MWKTGPIFTLYVEKDCSSSVMCVSPTNFPPLSSSLQLHTELQLCYSFLSLTMVAASNAIKANQFQLSINVTVIKFTMVLKFPEARAIREKKQVIQDLSVPAIISMPDLKILSI